MNRFTRLSLSKRTHPNPLRQEEKDNLIFFKVMNFGLSLVMMDVGTDKMSLSHCIG